MAAGVLPVVMHASTALSSTIALMSDGAKYHRAAYFAAPSWGKSLRRLQKEHRWAWTHRCSEQVLTTAWYPYTADSLLSNAVLSPVQCCMLQPETLSEAARWKQCVSQATPRCACLMHREWHGHELVI